MATHIPRLPLEIFYGTGGVGKTTLASTRAFHLAKQGRKVLLITIDPAKRLKDFLQIDENRGPGPTPVSSSLLWDKNPPPVWHLDGLLINPENIFGNIPNVRLKSLQTAGFSANKNTN